MKIKLALLALTLLAGCATAPAGVRAPAARMAAASARSLDAELRNDVLVGFKQIYKTYDQAPADGQLDFGEFGHVVTWEWFDAHDANGDGFVQFDEWHTPAEADAQVKAILAAGAYHVKAADQDQDGVLTLAEHLARTELEIDPTPWLNGAADPEIRTSAFKRFAPAGKLDAPNAARMVGALLAQGYYLDDGRDEVLRLPTRQ